MEDLLETYPNLQIAVPVHSDKWDWQDILPITFIPEEYTKSTPYVSGWNANGEPFLFSGTEEPDFPVFVVGLNERLGGGDDFDDPGFMPPPAPINLTVITTEMGIRISWEMPVGTQPNQVVGYNVYRKRSSEVYYNHIGSSTGFFNRSYNDNNVEASASYSYYVMAFDYWSESHSSNLINVTAPTFPMPVQSFDAIHRNINQTELQWVNNHNQFILETRLYRMVEGVNSNYILIGTFGAGQHYAFDNNITPEKKHTYKIKHFTSLGESNPKFDHVQVPYGDISQPSPVYIKMPRYTCNVSDIEGWLRGAPEFRINVDNYSRATGTPFTVQPRVFVQFPNRTEKNSGVLSGRHILNWNTNFFYDMLTFTAYEEDGGDGANYGVSVKYQVPDSWKIGGIEAGINLSHVFGSGDEFCGASYLNYYDNHKKDILNGHQGAWLEFPNYGFAIFVSETDW